MVIKMKESDRVISLVRADHAEEDVRESEETEENAASAETTEEKMEEKAED